MGSGVRGDLAGRRPQEVDFSTSGRASLETSYMYQRNGGDIAALFGISKALIELDEALKASGVSRVAGNDGHPADPQNAAMVAFAASMKGNTSWITTSLPIIPPALKASPTLSSSTPGQSLRKFPAFHAGIW